MNTKAVDMKHTLEGLLNCARIAFPGYEWASNVDGEVYRASIDPYKPVYFSLDSDSDVLALWKGLATKGFIISQSNYGPWYWKTEGSYKAKTAEGFNTLTDCLYAAAQEVGEL